MTSAASMPPPRPDAKSAASLGAKSFGEAFPWSVIEDPATRHLAKRILPAPQEAMRAASLHCASQEAMRVANEVRRAALEAEDAAQEAEEQAQALQEAREAAQARVTQPPRKVPRSSTSRASRSGPTEEAAAVERSAAPVAPPWKPPRPARPDAEIFPSTIERRVVLGRSLCANG